MVRKQREESIGANLEIEMVKCANGIFAPAFEHDLPRLTKFKNGEMYTFSAKLTRNPAFHKRCSYSSNSVSTTGAQIRQDSTVWMSIANLSASGRI